MLHKKLIILLCGCLLGAAGAWADDVGFVDCSGHPEETPVYAKPRRSQDVVVNLACGERFRVVLYGFIFSKIQTSDGKVGFILSSMISLDRVGGVPQQWESRPAAPVNPPTTTVTPAQPAPAPAVPTDSVAKKVTPAPPEPTPTVQPAIASSANIQPASPQAVTAEPASASLAVVSAAAPAKPASSTPEPASISTETSAIQPAAAHVADAVPQPAPAPAESAPPDSTPSASPAPAIAQPGVPESAPSAPPAPAAAEPAVPAKENEDVATSSVQPAQPNPARTSRPQPATYSVQPASMSQPIERTSWEKPNLAGKRPSLLELFGGYSFDRVNNAGTSTNFNGALASFGLNVRPWLQIVGDTSYNTVTVNGVKNILYGNHFGPRFYLRNFSRWSMTPFAEFLIGGSRADTSIVGLSGYTTSSNCISYKVGGGVDIRAGRHFEFRAIDAGYYRTSFGTNVTQNNYYVSAGFVVRLFGGSRSY